MAIKLHYCKGLENFGDELSVYLVEKITGKPCTYTSQLALDHQTLLAVGSLLSACNVHSDALVWGSGTLRAKPLTVLRNLFPMKLGKRLLASRHKKVTCFAVRGPKTRRILHNAQIACPEVYGDPAILLPLFYRPKSVSAPPQQNQRFSGAPIGLILHHSQQLRVSAEQLRERGIVTISIFRQGAQQIEAFVDEVCACQKIFSSSLHGVIVAQAYGIPAQWIRLKGSRIHKDDGHKFADYFLGAGQINQQALEMPNDLEGIVACTQHTPAAILPFEGREKLLEAFPFEALGVARPNQSPIVNASGR